MGISSPGIGSNLDVNGIVSKLMSVEQQPIALLDKKTASYNATLSGFGTLQSVVSQFQSAVSGLANISKFQGLTTALSDPTVATLSGSSIATPGSYSLEVSQLAQAQKLNAVGQTSTTAAIGAGGSTTLSFDFGSITGGSFNSTTGKYTGASFASNGSGIKTVTIDDTNNSLAGIRDAVNAADIGISASIVNDGSNTPYRLSLTVNNSGATNSLKLSVAGDSAVSSLLAQDPGADGGQGLSQTIAAQNSQFKLDGIAVTKPSNKVNDALPGVTLNLTKTNVGTPAVISLARDTGSVTTAVNTFVEAYNGLSQALKDAQAYDPATKVAAILNGESSVRTIQNQMRNILIAPISGSASTYTLLSQVGVTIQSTGLLAVDSAKLQTAVTTNFTQIAGLFSNVGSSSDALVTYNTASSKTAPGKYPVFISQLATKGQTIGGQAANQTITAGVNDTLGVTVDGITSNITLAPGTYANAGALATELQSKINGNSAFAGLSVAVTSSSGILSIVSNTFGSTSAATINDGNGKTALGFSSASTSASAGLNVAGTINGKTAVGTGQALLGATGDASEGLSIEITGGANGSRGSINYSQGYAYQFNQLTTSILATDGPIAARKDGINASLKDIALNKATRTDRLASIEARYRAQFTALDTLISQMSTTSSYLTQQLAAIAKNS